MKIVLKKVRWKNFLSTGNQWTEIDLCSHKTTLIVGRNGSGKSTLLDALFFVLLNRPFRNINKPQLINSINNKDCVVELEFELNKYEFKVIRGIKPNIFEIYQDGKLITEDSDRRDYQKAFERYILKIRPKTLEQVIALGSAVFIPFMALPTPQRRAIIEDLLDLEVFTKMNKLLKDKLDNAVVKLKEKENEKYLLDERHKLTEGHLTKVSQSKETQIANHLENLKNIDQNIIQLTDDFIKIQDHLMLLEKHFEPLPVLQKRREEITDIRSELAQKTRILNKELLFFEKNQSCPTCHQNIDEQFRETIVDKDKQKIKELENAVAILNEKLTGVDKQLDKIEETRKQHQSVTSNFIQKKTEIRNLTANKNNIEKEIEKIKEEDFTADFSQLNEIKEKLLEAEKAIFDLADDRTILDFAAVLLKDSGIKAKIIKTFLPVINQLIQKYLAALDFFVEFHLDEEFNETILSRHRDNFSYASFSEGEKTRLNLAILFAWRAVAKLRSSINCNLIIFDEVLDSLDSEGVDDILQALDLTTNDNIVIISHKESQISDRFSRVIKFEKVMNFSRIVE